MLLESYGCGVYKGPQWNVAIPHPNKNPHQSNYGRSLKLPPPPRFQSRSNLHRPREDIRARSISFSSYQESYDSSELDIECLASHI